MADGDRGVLLQEEQRERLADDIGASDHHPASPGKRHAGVLDEPHHGGGRAWRELRLPGDESAEVVEAETVDVFCRRDRLEHAPRIDPARQRQLHEDAVHGRVAVQCCDAIEQRAFADLAAVALHLGAHPGLFARTHLVAHIDRGGRVLACQDHREPGAHAARREPRHSLRRRSAHRSGESLPVEDARSHGGRAVYHLSHPVPRIKLGARIPSALARRNPDFQRANPIMSALPQFPAANDPDALETQEWLDSLEAVLEREGPQRAHYLLEKLIDKARRSGAYIPFSPNTAYINTIPPHMEERSPGNVAIEERIRSICRWNAMVMVVRANRNDDELGGHLATFASVGTLFGTGQQHFWHAPHGEHGGDLIYFQGHSSPGVYARSLMEGRLPEERLLNFRREVDGKGVSSYPHPWLMPEYWQFPTVSMGLGPIQAIYMARYLKYLEARGLAQTANRKVWVFCGDGEMDEPESLGAIGLAARERLDNLIFVVNCNLQRLDGPVRGNGKIIQELEGEFRGAGWNVIKVIWGSYWDPLLARDKDGILLRIMEESVDGEYQNYKANDGAFVRKHFFGKHPKALEMVAKLSDEDIWRLNRGGHDPHKVYAAYAAAAKHKGQPTVILAKTIKGYGLGKQGQAKNPTHQLKKVDIATIKEMRDQFNIPLPDAEIEELPFYIPPADAPEMKYLLERRKALGGFLPQRRRKADTVPGAAAVGFRRAAEGLGRRARDLDHDGVRARAYRARARQGHRQARRADRPRRGAHLRHGRHVPPARHLRRRRPEVRARRQGPGDVLPRGQAGADPRGRHHRGRSVLLLDRGGHLAQPLQPRHDPVLRLLLDVRPAARRRSRLGGGRSARARLLARRDGGEDYAERRRAAARRRALPCPRLGDP